MPPQTTAFAFHGFVYREMEDGGFSVSLLTVDQQNALTRLLANPAPRVITMKEYMRRYAQLRGVMGPQFSLGWQDAIIWVVYVDDVDEKGEWIEPCPDGLHFFVLAKGAIKHTWVKSDVLRVPSDPADQRPAAFIDFAWTCWTWSLGDAPDLPTRKMTAKEVRHLEEINEYLDTLDPNA